MRTLKQAEQFVRQTKPIKTKKEALALFGVGKKIAAKIEDFVATGTLRQLEERRKDPHLQAIRLFNTIYGVGPKTAKVWADKGLRTLDDLRKKPDLLNAKQKIGLKFVDDINERIPRKEVEDIFKFVRKFVLQEDKSLKVECCGSYRRECETSGDVDVLVTHEKKGQKSFKSFLNRLKEEKFLVADLSFGRSKYMGICRHPNYPKHRRIDVLYFDKANYYSALLWFTGSGLFNRALNIHAAPRSMQLNEKGLYRLTSKPGAKEKKKGDLIVVSSENEVFAKLGLKYLTPKQRDWGK